jgi:hypothetical protein
MASFPITRSEISLPTIQDLPREPSSVIPKSITSTPRLSSSESVKFLQRFDKSSAIIFFQKTNPTGYENQRKTRPNNYFTIPKDEKNVTFYSWVFRDALERKRRFFKDTL